jgi:hypothetical protein
MRGHHDGDWERGGYDYMEGLKIYREENKNMQRNAQVTRRGEGKIGGDKHGGGLKSFLSTRRIGCKNKLSVCTQPKGQAVAFQSLLTLISIPSLFFHISIRGQGKMRGNLWGGCGKRFLVSMGSRSNKRIRF